MKRNIATTSSLVPDQASVIRMDPVMPVPSQLWRPFPVTQQSDMLTQELENFWAQQRNEIENISGAPVRYDLPLTRIKRVMKSVPDVKIVSSESPVVLAKATELLIKELTLRAWTYARMPNRQILQARDFADAIRNSDLRNHFGDLFNPEQASLSNQAVAEGAPHPQVVPPTDVNGPSMSAPLDLEQILEQGMDSVLVDRFINDDDFELNPNIK